MRNYRNSCGAKCLGVKVMEHFGCGYLGAMGHSDMATEADF